MLHDRKSLESQRRSVQTLANGKFSFKLSLDCSFTCAETNKSLSNPSDSSIYVYFYFQKPIIAHSDFPSVLKPYFSVGSVVRESF